MPVCAGKRVVQELRTLNHAEDSIRLRPLPPSRFPACCRRALHSPSGAQCGTVYDQNRGAYSTSGLETETSTLTAQLHPGRREARRVHQWPDKPSSSSRAPPRTEETEKRNRISLRNTTRRSSDLHIPTANAQTVAATPPVPSAISGTLCRSEQPSAHTLQHRNSEPRIQPRRLPMHYEKHGFSKRPARWPKLKHCAATIGARRATVECCAAATIDCSAVDLAGGIGK